MSTPRLTSAMLASGLIRLCESAGGHAMVLAKGDAISGSILLLSAEKGVNTGLWERVLTQDGHYRWQAIGPQDIADNEALTPYIERRKRQDPDLWLIELDIPDGPRLIAQWTRDG